jgi:hypothetical protein
MDRPQQLYQTLVSSSHLLAWATGVMSKFFATHLSPFHISTRCPCKRCPCGPLPRIETTQSSVYQTNCNVFNKSPLKITTFQPQNKTSPNAPIAMLWYQYSLLRLHCHAVKQDYMIRQPPRRSVQKPNIQLIGTSLRYDTAVYN